MTGRFCKKSLRASSKSTGANFSLFPATTPPVLKGVRLCRKRKKASGRLVVDAEKIGFAYGDVKIIDTFSTKIMRGDKVGHYRPQRVQQNYA